MKAASRFFFLGAFNILICSDLSQSYEKYIFCQGIYLRTLLELIGRFKKQSLRVKKSGNGHREKDKRIRALTRGIGFSPKVSDFQRLPTNKKANPKGLACEFGSMNI